MRRARGRHPQLRTRRVSTGMRARTSFRSRAPPRAPAAGAGGPGCVGGAAALGAGGPGSPAEGAGYASTSPPPWNHAAAGPLLGAAVTLAPSRKYAAPGPAVGTLVAAAPFVK